MEKPVATLDKGMICSSWNYVVREWLPAQSTDTRHFRLSRPGFFVLRLHVQFGCIVFANAKDHNKPAQEDAAAFWNAEFVQAEELFKQPAALDNCLRDNRFCGILNSYVERNSPGTTNVAPQPKGVYVAGSSTNQVSSFPQPQHRKTQQSCSEGDLPRIATVVKSGGDNTSAQGGANKLSPDAGKGGQSGIPTSKNKAQTCKSNAGYGCLASFWCICKIEVF